MKLDAYLLREAASTGDVETIIRIFSDHFKEVSWAPYDEWMIVRDEWITADIRLKNHAGSFSWDRAGFCSDHLCWSYNSVIFINPLFKSGDYYT